MGRRLVMVSGMKFRHSDEALKLGYDVSCQRGALLECTRWVESEWFWWKGPTEMGQTYCDQPSKFHKFESKFWAVYAHQFLGF